MFSSRLDWAQKPNSVARALSERLRSGAEILDLTESNPTRARLPYEHDGIVDAFHNAGLLNYRPDPRGLQSAREAVSAYYADRALTVPVDRILLTASTSEAYSFLFHLLADPGDEILTPRPSYPLFEYLANLASVKLRQYPLRYDGTWHIDFDSLERSLTARTRAIVVVNPNNPTGSFVKPDELERLDELAARRGIAILSDEVFSDYAFGPSTTCIGKRRALTFTMSGLSKIAALPQMKLGWIVAGGPGATEALDALELIADTFLSVGTPVQVALPKLLALSQPVRDAIRTRTARQLAETRAALAGSAGTVLHTEGGWYVVIRVPRTRTEEQWILTLLNEAGVLVQPGYFFDFESEAYLVVSLLTQPDTFTEGLQRLRAFL